MITPASEALHQINHTCGCDLTPANQHTLSPCSYRLGMKKSWLQFSVWMLSDTTVKSVPDAGHTKVNLSGIPTSYIWYFKRATARFHKATSQTINNWQLLQYYFLRFNQWCGLFPCKPRVLCKTDMWPLFFLLSLSLTSHWCCLFALFKIGLIKEKT